MEYIHWIMCRGIQISIYLVFKLDSDESSK